MSIPGATDRAEEIDRVIWPSPGVEFYRELMLDISTLELDEIATALSDQHDYEHQWLIDPETGEVVFWRSDSGIDGQNPVDLDELELNLIDPLPSHIWYQDMADFISGISDQGAARRLDRAIAGRGAFGRFRRELYEEYPDLIGHWHAFRDIRAKRRAVEWLLGEGPADEGDARRFLLENPDPSLP